MDHGVWWISAAKQFPTTRPARERDAPQIKFRIADSPPSDRSDSGVVSEWRFFASYRLGVPLLKGVAAGVMRFKCGECFANVIYP